MKKIISYFLILTILITCFSNNNFAVNEITQTAKDEKLYLLTSLLYLKNRLRETQDEEERERLEEAVKALSKNISR